MKENLKNRRGRKKLKIYFSAKTTILVRNFFIGLVMIMVNVNCSNSFIYVCTNEGSEGSGVYCASFDKENGTLGEFSLVAELEKAGFLTMHPSNNLLYSTGMVAESEAKSGCIAGYSADRRSGELTFLNRQKTGEELPSYICITKNGRYLLNVSYFGATCSVLEIKEDGSLGQNGKVHAFSGSGINEKRQSSSHPHSINIDSKERYVYVCDLGADNLVRFQFDSNKGDLTRIDPLFNSSEPGAGPRHMRFSGDGKWAYVINELNNSISVYAYDSDTGKLVLIQVISTLLFDGNYEKQLASEIRLHPNEQFLYASNRSVGSDGSDGIMVYRRDKMKGTLEIVEWVTTGKHPRHFNIDKDGRWLLVSARDSNEIQIFEIDKNTGGLRKNGEPAKFMQPLYIQFYN
jgi:6-phosphogluconolactonase